MGNILKVISPVAGVEEDTFKADLSPPNDVNNPLVFSEEITEACITSLHGTLVEILEDKICSKSPVHSKLKEVLATAEQQMHKHAIPFATQRHRSLEDMLDEDWLEPHCNFPDTVDFWPPPPPRTLPWRPTHVPRSGFTSPCTNSSHCIAKEDTEAAVLPEEKSLHIKNTSYVDETHPFQESVSGKSGLTSPCTNSFHCNTKEDTEAAVLPEEKSLHIKDISNVDNTYSSKENVSSQLRQISHSIDDHFVEKIPDYLNFTWKPCLSRPVALIAEVSAENGRFAQSGSHICNVPNTNSSSCCDKKSYLSEEQGVLINGNSSQSSCSCDTSQLCFTFDHKLVVEDSDTKLEMSTMQLSSASTGVRTSSDCTKILDPDVVPCLLQPIDTYSPLSEKIVELLNVHRFVPINFITFSLMPLECYSGLKYIIDNWMCYEQTNLRRFVSPITSCVLDISSKTFASQWSRSLPIEPFSWACLANKMKSMHTLFYSSSLTDQGDSFPAIRFISLSQKLKGDFSNKLPFFNSPSISSSPPEQSCHGCKFQAAPISHTPVNYSAEEILVTSSHPEEPCHGKFQAAPISHTPVNHCAEKLLVTELSSVTAATAQSAPASSSRLTGPSLISKSQLLLMLLEPVARLAASHRRCTHQALCSSEVCISTLLHAMRSPDPRVQETAAKAAANMACSAHGVTLLWEAGAPATLYQLAGSPCFAVQLAACRALLNLRRPCPGYGLCFKPHSCSSLAGMCGRNSGGTHNLNFKTSNLYNCCEWDHNSRLIGLQNLNLKTSNPNNCHAWDLHDCACCLRNCTPTTVDSSNLFLQRVAPGQKMSNILRSSSVGPEIDLHSAPEESTKHRLPFLERCKHKLGSSNRPSHKEIPISVEKPCLKCKLTFNEQSVNHTKCKMPLMQCDGNPKALCHSYSISSCGKLDGEFPGCQSIFSLGNSDASVSMSVHQCKCSSDFSRNIPVYEEGIYPILSSSDILKLRESFVCATDDRGSVQKPDDQTQSPDSVKVHIPHGSSLSGNCYSTCSELQHIEEFFKNSHSDDGTSGSNVSSMVDNSRNEERLPARASGRLAGGSVRAEPPRVVDVVLLHGVLGGAAWTWRQHDDARSSNGEEDEAGGYSWCWPRDWLAGDLLRETGTRLRIIAINGAEPWHLSDPRSLRQEGERLRGALLRAGVGRRPLVWLAHSHGGLLLKAILGDCQDEAGAAVEISGKGENAARLSNASPPESGGEGVCTALCTHTAGVVFLSTPHRGTPWAAPASLLHPSISELADLCSDNAELGEVSRQFEACWQGQQFPVLSVVDTLPLQLGPGLSVLPVPPASAAAGVGETLHVATDHLNVCKPRSRNCDVYAAVLNFFVRATSDSR